MKLNYTILNIMKYSESPSCKNSSLFDYISVDKLQLIATFLGDLSQSLRGPRSANKFNNEYHVSVMVSKNDD